MPNKYYDDVISEEEREMLRRLEATPAIEQYKQTRDLIAVQIARMEKTIAEEGNGMSPAEVLKWSRLVSDNIKELRLWDNMIEAEEARQRAR